MYPSNYRYLREHQWVSIDEDSVTLGITEFAKQELGEIVFVEMPEIGQNFQAGDKFGTLESVKAVAELYTPFTCEILAVNDAVVDDPEILNEDPHGEGWLVKFRVTSVSEVNSLMNSEQYEEYVKSGG
jgi:glycine cleavage system H protein